MPLSRRQALLALACALLGLAGLSDGAFAKNGGGGGSGGGGSSGGGSGSSGKGGDGGGDDGGGDNGGGDDGGGDDGGGDDGGGNDNSGKGNHRDQKRAKDALKNGKARPLPEILQAVSGQYPGKVIDVRLNRRSDVLMYDVKLITPEGKLIRVRVNAASGTIVGIKGI